MFDVILFVISLIYMRNRTRSSTLPCGTPDATKMAFNVDKCNVMHITRARTTKKHPYVMHDQQLEIVTETKYLVYGSQTAELYSTFGLIKVLTAIALVCCGAFLMFLLSMPWA
jgi:hypothetical protein